MHGLKSAFAAAAAAAALGLVTGCMGSGDKTIAEYCANPGNANKDTCKLNADIQETRSALGARIDRTERTVGEARNLAEGAAAAATRAQQSADAALARQDGIYCETRTIQRADTGTCSPGYLLVGCTQSRFTYRAGGPTVMRDINDQQCRFAQRVLEMKVRCCMVGNRALPQVAAQPPARRYLQPRRPTS
jgi:hypothetical protein